MHVCNVTDVSLPAKASKERHKSMCLFGDTVLLAALDWELSLLIHTFVIGGRFLTKLHKVTNKIVNRHEKAHTMVRALRAKPST